MNSKRLSMLMVLMLVLLVVPIVTACGYTTDQGDYDPDAPLPQQIPHELDMKFDNCFVCHIGGQVPAGAEYPFREDHGIYPVILCSGNPACHPGPDAPTPTIPPTTTTTTTTTTTPPTTGTTTTPPTTGTTTTPPTTGTTTTPPTTTTSEPPTTAEPPKITAHATGPGYDGLCLICHMLGGTDPVPDDHEGRTVDECYDCHEAG